MKNRRAGRTMKVFDAAIAATAIDLACPLIVRDNDFDGIDGLTVEKI
jgi:predicted nucleic acid-binding protein